MNETRSGVNDRPRPSVVSRSSRRQLPTVTSSSGTEPEGRGWSDKRRMWEGAWKGTVRSLTPDLRLSRSLLSPRLFPPLSIPALSLPSFFRSERAAGEWREGKRREERELNGKLSHVPGLTHRFHAPITSARRMFVPGSLVTSLPYITYY